jgi:hypothetical protein
MQPKHFSEADLLETYYTQPGESMPVMMHLAECEDCASRYERLERKIRGTRACHVDDQPETFWTRQRLTIMRRVAQQKKRTWSTAQTLRIAAVAVFAFVLGGVATYRTIEPATTTTATQTASVATTPATADTSIPADPWESEELDEFHSMVDWETWGDPKS